MRRVLAVFLLLVLLCSIAIAESNTDLSGLSLSELFELRRLINTEIDARMADDALSLPAGVYIGGETIKTGRYMLFTDDDMHGDVVVCKDIETYERALAEKNDGLALFHTYLGRNSSAFVDINDSTVLYTTKTLMIRPFDAEWIP